MLRLRALHRVLGALGGVRVVGDSAQRLSLELAVTRADANADAEEAETEDADEAEKEKEAEANETTLYTLHLERGGANNTGNGAAFESVRIEPASAPIAAATADVIAHFLRSSSASAASSTLSSAAVVPAPSSQPLAFLVRETRARLALMQRRGAEIAKLAARCDFFSCAVRVAFRHVAFRRAFCCLVDVCLSCVCRESTVCWLR